MKWRVEIGAGVGDHFDLADVELGPRRIERPRLLSAQEVAHEWGRKPAVRYHSAFDDVAYIDQHGETPAQLRASDSPIKWENPTCAPSDFTMVSGLHAEHAINQT